MIVLFGFFLICVSGCVSEVERRIYYGYQVPIQNYPHCVFLHFQNTRPSSCGASLVSSQAILTAAHCVDELRYDRGYTDAFMGHAVPMHATVVRTVVGFVVHPKYNEINGRNNLAVAFFNSRVPLSGTIKKIPLTNRHPIEDEFLYSAGWGKQQAKTYLQAGAPQHRSIRASRQRAIDQSTCRRLSGLTTTPTQLCTMPFIGFMHIDDSGDGLVTRGPVAMLVGVLSFVSHGINLYSTVYVNRAWIRNSIVSMYHRHCTNKEKMVDKMFKNKTIVDCCPKRKVRH